MILADILFRARFGLQKYNSNAKKQNKQNRFKLRKKTQFN